MKLEDQVCSLDLSKRLKELGVKQESLFYWHRSAVDNKWMVSFDLLSYEGWDEEETYSAFTVAELGEIMKDKGMGVTAHSSLINEWWIRGGIYDFGKHQYNHIETDVKWSDCLAKMLVYLLENKLITL